MAEGGYDPTTENETPWEDHGIDHDDDDEEYKTPLSSPIKQPPEEIEMSQLPREQKSKWQLSKQTAWVALKKIYPQANKEALEAAYVKIPGEITPRLSIKTIGATRAYWLFEPNLLGRWRENLDLPQEIKTYIGKSIEKQIEGFNHGPLDTEAIQKLKDEKRALEAKKKTIQQQISQQQKDMSQYNKIQAEVEQLTHDTRELDQHLNELRAKEETLKPLDELEQEAEELNRKIKEDRQLIDDENTSSPERMSANVRLLENEAELDRINTEIEVRERQKPLLERVKDIFKKYGWTLQAFFVAVGVILSVIALTVKKGFKYGTKVVGQKLKNTNHNPGMFSSIVSFIFKAAGQVFSFLSEHTWLIILVVVAFFIEKLLKRRRR